MLFVEDVLNEVMDVFPSPYIHIGGDECPKVRWEKCPKCQAKIKELGIKKDDKFTAEDYLQSYVMNRMAKVVEARGRRVIGWDEILEGNVSETAIIMSWRGTEGGIEAARKGHDVIMAPSSHLYFDYYQSEDIASEPMCIGGYLPVERVYEFQPLPEELTPEQQKHIIGVQANIWTEYIAHFWHVQYMALPRMEALTEIQWNNPQERDFGAFVERCRHMTQLYELYHYTYADHIFNPQVWADTVEANLATRKPITLRQQPAEKYTYEGASLLNDGNLGRGAYNSGRWLGFCGYPLDAIIDLEQPAEMQHVRFHALVNKGAWIYNPSQVKVLVSDDGETFREVAQKDIPISTWEDRDGIFAYEVDFEPVTAKFVEVVISGYDLPEDHSGFQIRNKHIIPCCVLCLSITKKGLVQSSIRCLKWLVTSLLEATTSTTRLGPIGSWQTSRSICSSRNRSHSNPCCKLRRASKHAVMWTSVWLNYHRNLPMSRR